MTTSRAKFCWTCGGEFDVTRFEVDVEQYDGLSAECKRCEECREMARRMDGETGPRTYRIEGEGRRKAPKARGRLTRAGLDLQASLRRRPRSGLAATY